LDDRPVVNSSPLIVLAAAGHLHLLRMLGRRMIVPLVVAHEVRRYGDTDPAHRALAELDWLDVIDTGPVAAAVRACRVDAGESAVLTWALLHPGTTAVIDDRLGRRCAAVLGITTRGTLGLILIAKRRGVIPAARPVIESVRAAGLYLSQRVIDAALAEVGE
jgi:predicted nucleic acid-binding protein